MMRKRTKVSFIVAALFLIIGLHRFCEWKADGFCMSRIAHNTFDSISPLLSLLSQDEANDIISQKFRYLARGKQSFVFVSEDDKYVLKLFNNHYQSKIKTLSLLPSFFSREKIAYNQKKMELVKESYLLAVDELNEETGVLLLHLSPTSDLKKKVSIIDKLGIKHQIDLDQTGFLIQKRATPAYAQLASWLECGEQKKVKQALSDIVHLLVARCKKGIEDRDPLIRTNLGFREGHPLFLDLGPFSKSREIQKRENYTPEILKITTSLKEWLQSRDPSLALYLEEELQRTL